MKKLDIVKVLEKDESYYRLLWDVAKKAFTSGLFATILALVAAVGSLVIALLSP